MTSPAWTAIDGPAARRTRLWWCWPGRPARANPAWAATRFRAAEIVSSDALRGIVGSGPADLDASVEAFDLLDQIVAARTRRGLTTVIDTLGLDADRRSDYLRLARSAGLPAVLVIIDTPPALCRRRNRDRDRPVPAPVLSEQLRKIKSLIGSAADEGWEQVLIIEGSGEPAAAADPPATVDHDQQRRGSGGPRVILQVSRSAGVRTRWAG